MKKLLFIAKKAGCSFYISFFSTWHQETQNRMLTKTAYISLCGVDGCVSAFIFIHDYYHRPNQCRHGTPWVKLSPARSNSADKRCLVVITSTPRCHKGQCWKVLVIIVLAIVKIFCCFRKFLLRSSVPNCQENTCAGFFYLRKLQVSSLQLYLKWESNTCISLQI